MARFAWPGMLHALVLSLETGRGKSGRRLICLCPRRGKPMLHKEDAPMTYSISRADLDTITDSELARSTTKLLPQWTDIPAEFRDGNVYTRMAEARLLDYPMPDVSISFLPGFQDDGACKAIDRCLVAHLKAFAPRHEHRIAGVGYMLSKICRITAA
jgi:hypothetical protein